MSELSVRYYMYMVLHIATVVLWINRARIMLCCYMDVDIHLILLNSEWNVSQFLVRY